MFRRTITGGGTTCWRVSGLGFRHALGGAGGTLRVCSGSCSDKGAVSGSLLRIMQAGRKVLRVPRKVEIVTVYCARDRRGTRADIRASMEKL